MVVYGNSYQYNFFMPKTLGYMITWTTYGSWLQGDSRGFVKNGKILSSNLLLADSNKRNLSKEPVKISKNNQSIVADSICEKAKQLNQKIYALSVSSNHVHIVAEYIAEPIGRVVAAYKSAAQVALRRAGISGRIWTRGFDKRFCFDEQTLRNRIDYVKSHNRNSKNI